MNNIWLIEKYVKLCNLEGLKKTGNGYSFRCTVCGDSKTNKKKQRGCLLVNDNRVTYYCHNCNISISFKTFLKKYRENLYDSFVREEFLEKVKRSPKHESAPIEKAVSQPDKIISLDALERARENKTALYYCLQRKFPESFIDTLYYTDNYISFIKNEKSAKSDKRIVIPFYNEKKELTHIQGRTIEDSSIKYLSYTLKHDADKIWGLDRIDKTKDVFLFEGVFDACFLPNSLALAGINADIKMVLNHVNKKNLIFVPDNDFRKNVEVRFQTLKYIREGFRIVLFPNINYKDFNDMVIHGFKLNRAEEFLKKHVYSGLNAEIRLKMYRRI